MKTVTIHNLHESTAQEVFDFVRSKLTAQGEQCRANPFPSTSKVPGACLYRNAKGQSCAAGFLMTDEDYSRDYEDGYGWTDLVEQFGFPAHHMGLIEDLQDSHDNYDPDQWEERFAFLAVRHELKYEN